VRRALIGLMLLFFTLAAPASAQTQLPPESEQTTA